MAVNDLSFNQLSTVLNAIVKQATGQTPVTPTNTSEFVSVAQTALKTGYDPVISAVSQVLGRTIFSIRPYSRKFAGLQVDNQKWGYITRKLQAVDKPFENDDRIPLTDGTSVDMYKINKPQVVQTNFYGQNVWQKSLTIFRDQLDCAFSSPDEFSRFITMITSNASDMIEQAHEATARATIGNFIGGINASRPTSVIHLLTEYNTLTGLELTSETVYLPANFPSFIRWVYSRIATLSSLLTERSAAFHTNITGNEVMRHTPVQDQLVYLYAPVMNQISSSVLSDTFHDGYLKMATTEAVNYWQAFNAPNQIQVQPTYLSADGLLTTAQAATTVTDIFGFIADREALGYTVMNQWSAATPFNARGGYTNMYWHFTERYWNDFMENGIVLLLN